MHTPRVYLSSTYQDLIEHRRAAAEAIRSADVHCRAMEGYTASDERPLDKCLDDVANCDLYVGLFGHRYGPMLIVLGSLLLVTILPDGRLWKMWSAAAGLVTRRRWAALVMCGATLWVLEPERSHEYCMNAADFCAVHGYYTPAIALTELGRDTFPPLNVCGTCYRAELLELSSRIALLRAKRAGYREERRVAATRIEHEPPSVTPSPWGAEF